MVIAINKLFPNIKSEQPKLITISNEECTDETDCGCPCSTVYYINNLDGEHVINLASNEYFKSTNPNNIKKLPNIYKKYTYYFFKKI